VQERKNRRVGPDTKAHGKNHHQAEERRLHQAAKRKPYACHTLLIRHTARKVSLVPDRKRYCHPKSDDNHDPPHGGTAQRTAGLARWFRRPDGRATDPDVVRRPDHRRSESTVRGTYVRPPCLKLRALAASPSSTGGATEDQGRSGGIRPAPPPSVKDLPAFQPGSPSLCVHPG